MFANNTGLNVQDSSGLQDIAELHTGSLQLKVEPEENELEMEEEEEQSATVQLQQLCRMCAQPCSVAMSSSLLGLSAKPLCSALLQYFGINVMASDGLPTRLCVSCGRELQHWEQVKSSVAQAQHFLRQQLELQGTQDLTSVVPESVFLAPSETPSQNAGDILRQTLQLRETRGSKNKSIISDKDPLNQNTELPSADDFDSHIVATQSTVLPNLSENINSEGINIEKSDNVNSVENQNAKIILVSLHPNQLFISNEHYICKICNRRFINNESLVKHEETHNLTNNTAVLPHRSPSPNYPFECVFCPIKYNKPRSLLEHLKAHVSADKTIKKIPCPRCKVVFKNTKMLVEHLELHVKYPNRELGFPCKECKKEFLNVRALNIHSTVHQKPRIYKCSLCVATYKHNTYLISHLKRHSDGLIKSNVNSKDNSDNSATNSSQDTDMNDEQVVKRKRKCKTKKTPLSKKIPKIDKGDPSSTVPEKNNYFISEPETDAVQNQGQNFVPIQVPGTSSNSSQIWIRPATKIQNISSIVPKNLPLPLSVINSITIKPPIKKPPTYPCGICRLHFNNSTSYLSHLEDEMIKIIKKKQLPCAFCNTKYQNLHELVEHTENHLRNQEELTESIFVCHICFEVFDDENHCDEHKFAQHGRKFKCTLCSSIFPKKLLLEEHLKSAHTTESAVSSTEQNAVESQPIKVKSKKMLATESIKTTEHYSCDICNCKFFTPTLLYEHYLEKHVHDDDFKCEFCTKLFNNKEELLIHLKTLHAEMKKYFCPICGRGFKLNQAMKTHTLLHSLDRKYPCKLCDKTYRSYITLFDHIKTKHKKDKGRVMCEMCSKFCINKAKLRRHMFNKHSHVMPHTCNTCGKGYVDLGSLKDHEYTHTNIKPLHCTKCNKGFIYKKHWRNHMRNICKLPDKDITYFSKLRISQQAALTEDPL